MWHSKRLKGNYYNNFKSIYDNLKEGNLHDPMNAGDEKIPGGGGKKSKKLPKKKSLVK